MAKNLKRYLDRTGKDRAIVCEELGIPYSTFSDWLKARRYPSIGRIELMADYFGIEKSDLIEKSKIRETVVKSVEIPILGSVAAGQPIETIVDIKGYIEIPQEMLLRGNYFALKIKGRSMEPAMMDGDVIVVREQKMVENDEIAVVVVDSEEATVKQIKIDEKGLMLVPFNRDYQPLFFTPDEVENKPVTIIGKLVELRRFYD
jgi:repressor LexA